MKETFGELKNEILKTGAQLIDSSMSDTAAAYKDTKITRSAIGPDCSIGDQSIIYESLLEGSVSINRRGHVTSSTIGYGTYTNHNTTIRDANVGKFCCISWDVSVGGKDHNYKNAALYSPYWWSKTFDKPEGVKEQSFPQCKIGNDVWISSGANILRTVTVGDGAVIAAGAVVTKDVEPYTIVAGVPAKPIKKRFDDKTIETLLRIKWWDWPYEVIRENVKWLNTELNDQSLEILSQVADKLK